MWSRMLFMPQLLDQFELCRHADKK
jgi:hypothetical protein